MLNVNYILLLSITRCLMFMLNDDFYCLALLNKIIITLYWKEILSEYTYPL